MKDNIKYPEKMYCKLISKDMGYLFGACSNIPYPDEDCLEYVRADLIPQWQPIPTDKDGFGDWEETFEKANIVAYHDGTIYGQPDFDGELAGDIERHPDRFKWMRVDNPFENNEQ